MSRFKNSTLTCLGTLFSLASTAPAQAQSVPTSVGARATAGNYNFNVALGSVSVSGIITTNSTGHATSIYGLVNGTDPLTGLSSYAGADNDLYATGAWVTYGGLSFSTKSLGDFNFYNSGLGYYGLLSSVANPNGYSDGRISTARVAPVPEPSTWAMFLIGFVAIGRSVRIRNRSGRKLLQVA